MTRARSIGMTVTLALVLLALGFGLGRGVGGKPAAGGKVSLERVALPTLPEGARPEGGEPTASASAPATTAPASAPAPAYVGPGGAPAPVFFPRPAGEWQGMLVNTTMQAACDTSARCGLAMACHEGKCGACTADADCGGGEACVLDHCVKQEHVACRHKTDCKGDEWCVLSGYSNDLRGNGEMTASCRGDSGGTTPAEPEQVARPQTRPAAPAAVDPQAMMASLRDPAPAAAK